MNVELAVERIQVIADRFPADEAEARAWAKRTEAFGALAMLGGMIAKPRDEEFEIVYRERRLQPFWRLSAHTDYTYERKRDHRLKVGPHVQTVTLSNETIAVAAGHVAFSVVETCREESRREWYFDGLTRAAQPGLKAYAGFDARIVDADELNAEAKAGVVVVPPQAKSSSLAREVLSKVIPKIEADRILQEKIQVDAIDLYYRPVHAFRYRWQGKEAVVEFDAATGDTKTGGATFESYVGKIIDPAFLLDVGAEAANMFIPGVNLAKIMVVKGMQLRGKG